MEKIYSYFCSGFRCGLGSLEHNFEGSGFVQVHWSKILLVQVRFGFTKMKRFIRVYSSGSGSVRHPGCNARFWSKKKIALSIFFQVPAYCIPHAQPNRESNPGAEGWELSIIITTPPSLQHCSDKMSYWNQMYDKKAMARAWAFAWLASTVMNTRS